MRELLGVRTGAAPFTPFMGLAERQTDGAEDWWQLIALSGNRMQLAKKSGAACCADHRRHHQAGLNARVAARLHQAEILILFSTAAAAPARCRGSSMRAPSNTRWLCRP